MVAGIEPLFQLSFKRRVKKMRNPIYEIVKQNWTFSSVSHANRNEITDAVFRFRATGNDAYLKLAANLADVFDEVEFLNWAVEWTGGF